MHSGAEQQIVDDYVRRHPDHTPSTNVLVQASGKLVLIDKLLPKLKANGHKVCTAMLICSIDVSPLIYMCMCPGADILSDGSSVGYSGGLPSHEELPL